MTEPTGPGSSSAGKTFDVPKVGKVKRVYVYAGVGLVGLAAILWYRNHNAASALNTGATATDPAGNVGVIDPSTGFVYGSPQDVDALAAMGGSGGGGSGGGGSSSGGTDIGTQVSNGPPFANNEAWDAYATQYLVGSVGLDPGQVATDLGKYLTGAQVSINERDTVIAPAIGAAGPAPVAGPNGFPPSINLAGSTSGSGAPPGPLSLSVGAVTTTSGVVKWTPVSGATSYVWKATGTGAPPAGTTSGSSVTLTGLNPGSSYTVTVQAKNSSGVGPAASITFKAKPSNTGAGGQSGQYVAVPVVAYTTKNPPWDSTISGIAQHYGYGSDWEAVWDDPRNADLRAKRHAPNEIRPGDTVYVKQK